MSCHVRQPFHTACRLTSRRPPVKSGLSWFAERSLDRAPAGRPKGLIRKMHLLDGPVVEGPFPPLLECSTPRRRRRPSRRPPPSGWRRASSKTQTLISWSLEGLRLSPGWPIPPWSRRRSPSSSSSRSRSARRAQRFSPLPQELVEVAPGEPVGQDAPAAIRGVHYYGWTVGRPCS